MHIVAEEQEGGERSVLCVDKGSELAHILSWTPETFGYLVRIARTLGAPRVYVILDEEDIPGARIWGFERATDKVLMVKEMGDGT